MKKRTRRALVAAIKKMKRSAFRTSFALDTALMLIESSDKRACKSGRSGQAFS